MKLLFWNLQKKELTSEVIELFNEQNPDLIGFAEGDGLDTSLLTQSLRDEYDKDYIRVETPGCEKLIVFKKAPACVELMTQHKDYSLLKLSLNGQDYVLCFVHLPSKLHQTDEQQRRACERLYNQVSAEEERHNIEKSIIIGDFNINPFESAMISFSGLAATNGIDCCLRKSVMSDGETKKLFYNPMWTLYKDYKLRPGSHRYIKTGVSVATWHILDQIVMRPDLVDFFNFDSLSFLTKTENYSYISSNGKPSLSDHLPLVCEFNIGDL